jgi:hypothetical protein
MNATPCRAKRVGTLLSVVAVLGGCDPGSAASPVMARDSLGIAILEINLAQIDGWGQVQPSPEWIIGADESLGSDLALHDVVDVAVAEGIVWIAHRSSQEVVGVPLDGGHVIRLGGAGDGPGEFRRLSRVWSVGPGRVGAFDHAQQRYVEFTGSGDLTLELRLRSSSESGDLPDLYRVGGHSDEPVFYQALMTGLSATPTAGPYRGRGPLVRLADPPDTIAWVNGTTTFVGEQVAGAVIFGATSHVAEGRDGVWVGDSARPEVVMWSEGAKPARIVRWNEAGPQPVNASRRDQFWDRLARSSPDGDREMMGQLRDVVVFAETVPEFGSLRVSPDGLVWVGGYVDPEYGLLEEPWPAQKWVVLDVAAEAAGTIKTPSGLRVLQVGRDFVAGVHTGALGVQTVRLHRIAYDRLAEGGEG